jgi:hypothetical protein
MDQTTVLEKSYYKNDDQKDGITESMKIPTPLEQALMDLGIGWFTQKSVDKHKKKVKIGEIFRLKFQIMKEEDLLERRMKRADVLKFFLSSFAFIAGVVATMLVFFRWAVAIIAIYLSTGTTINSMWSNLLFGVVMLGIPVTLLVYRKAVCALFDNFFGEVFEEALIPTDQIEHLNFRLYNLDWYEYPYGSSQPFLRGAPNPPLEVSREMKRQVNRMKKYLPHAEPFVESLDSEPFFGFKYAKGKEVEKKYTENWGEPKYPREYEKKPS